MVVVGGEDGGEVGGKVGGQRWEKVQLGSLSSGLHFHH